MPDPPLLLGVELVLAELRLRRPVATAAGTHDRRPVLFARVVTDAAEGWGECGALLDGTAVDPPVEEVRREADRHCVGRLLAAAASRGGPAPPASVVRALFGGDPRHAMAAAMLEMGVLDAELQAGGRSLAGRLGVNAGTAVALGAVVGIPPGHDVGALVAALDEAVAAGARRVRLKIAPGWDVAPVAAARERHPTLVLQADANGAYRLGGDGEAAADALAALDPYDLACIEQPLAPADLTAHAALAGVLATPVCLDESLTSPRRVVDALRYGAMGVACLKPGRLGGLLAAVGAQERCAAAGVGAFVGGFFETGLGRCANLALAGLDGFTLPGDLSPPSGYLVESPFGYPQPRDGLVQVPGGPGIGAAPDADVVRRCATWRRWFGAPAAVTGGRSRWRET